MRGKSSCRKTTYIADSHPTITKPRQGNNINVNGYKNTEYTQKQTNINSGKYVSTALERSVKNVTGGFKPGL